MSIPMEERRQPRFLLNLPVEYRLGNSSICRSGATLHVNGRGLRGFFPEKLAVGRDLSLKILFSLGIKDPVTNVIDLKAEVVWANERREERGYLCELRFREGSTRYIHELGLLFSHLAKSQRTLKSLQQCFPDHAPAIPLSSG